MVNLHLRRAVSILAAIVMSAGLVVGSSTAPAEAATRQKASLHFTTHVHVRDTVRVRGRIRAHKAKVVVRVQQRMLGSSKWSTIKKIRTKRGGYYSTKITLTSAKDRRLRVKVSRTRWHGRVYRAAVTKSKRLYISPIPAHGTYSMVEEIPFSTQKIPDADLRIGTSKVEVAGKNGLRRVTYVDGKLSTIEVVSEPVTRVIRVGTGANTKPTAWITGCYVQMDGTTPVARAVAEVADPDNVGYNLTIHLNARDMPFGWHDGDNRFSTYIVGANTAVCDVTLN